MSCIKITPWDGATGAHPIVVSKKAHKHWNRSYCLARNNQSIWMKTDFFWLKVEEVKVECDTPKLQDEAQLDAPEKNIFQIIATQGAHSNVSRPKFKPAGNNKINSRAEKCQGIEGLGFVGLDQWCNNNCQRGFCPRTFCHCYWKYLVDLIRLIWRFWNFAFKLKEFFEQLKVSPTLSWRSLRKNVPQKAWIHVYFEI